MICLMMMTTMIDNVLLLYDHEGESPQPDKGRQPSSSKGRLEIFIREIFDAIVICRQSEINQQSDNHSQAPARVAWRFSLKREIVCNCGIRGYQKTPIFEIQRMPYLIPFLWSWDAQNSFRNRCSSSGRPSPGFRFLQWGYSWENLQKRFLAIKSARSALQCSS